MGRRIKEEVVKMMEEKYGIPRERGMKIYSTEDRELSREELVAKYDNPNVGKLFIPYEVADKLVNMFAKKYTECINMDKEDMASDLMLHLLIKTPDNVNLASSILKNKARDIYRTKKREMNKEVLMDMNSTQMDEGQENTEMKLTKQLGCDLFMFEEEGYEDVEANILGIFRKIDDYYKSIGEEKIGEKVKNYLVVVGYINEGLEVLEPAYKFLVKNLREENREMLYGFLRENDKLTKDMVYKVFLDMKNGINSGSAYKIKVGVETIQRMLPNFGLCIA